MGVPVKSVIKSEAIFILFADTSMNSSKHATYSSAKCYLISLYIYVIRIKGVNAEILTM